MLLLDESLKIIHGPPIVAYRDNILPASALTDIDTEINSIQWSKLFNRAGSYMLECNDIASYHRLRNLYFTLSSADIIKQLETITGINHLIPDPHMVGAGYSQIKDSGDLKPHIDFNWNDRLKLYRACTVMIYLTTPESGGEIEFIDVVKLPVKRNRVIIFNHSETIRHFVHPVSGIRNAVRFFYYTSNLITPQTYHRSLYGLEDNKPVDI
jgi:hypothetical protein